MLLIKYSCLFLVQAENLRDLANIYSLVKKLT